MSFGSSLFCASKNVVFDIHIKFTIFYLTEASLFGIIKKKGVLSVKEIIAKRYKKTYIYMLIFSLVALVPAILVWNLDKTSFVSIVMVVALGFAAAVSVMILLDKGGVVERDGDTFIIKRGVVRSVVNIWDVTNAYRTPCQRVQGQLQDFSITIIVRDTDGVQKEIVLHDVMDEDDAVNNILRCLK